MTGVLAEAAVVTWLVRPTLARHLSANLVLAPASLATRTTNRALNTRHVLHFHAPLAGTSLLALLSQPLISAGLARMASPELSLAAWPVAFSILLPVRSFAFAVQEVVIALARGPTTLGPLRRFSVRVAVGAMLLLALIAFTPLVDHYLREILNVSPELARSVVPGLRVALLLPGLTALQSWLRGLLMRREATASIYQAMGLNLAVTGAVVVLGVILRPPGVQMAFVALTVAMLAEVAFLGSRARRKVGLPTVQD